MPDPNLTIPESSTPNWLMRYSDRRARTYERRILRNQDRLTGWRTRAGRRRLVAALVMALALTIGASALAFRWYFAATIPFLVGVFASLIALSALRITNDGVADAPAQALDEIQLAQRNAARSLAYLILVALMLGIYFGMISLGMLDQVSGHTVSALAWLMISTVLAVTCLPDILLSWWMPDVDD